MTSHFPAIVISHHFLMLLLYGWLAYSSCHARSMINKDMNVQCLDKERDALLQLKHDILIDHCGLLDSWGGGLDCCQWRGIHCNNYTGHVTMLHLRGNGPDHYYEFCLEGTIGVSLAELQHLEYLDLSFNHFQWKSTPKFIGSLGNLEYLNLSNTGFGGVLPQEIGNLSRLSSLDLSSSVDSGESLSWISNLRLLKEINLGGIDLSHVSNWVSVVNNLPYLEVLHMDLCSLSSKLPTSLSYVNSSNTLRVISLSGNSFDGTAISHWLNNFSRIDITLTYLDFSANQLTDEFASFVWKLSSLTYLNLQQTGMSGQIPTEIGKMHNLKYLNLGWNNLSGQIPTEIKNVDKLSYLSLAGNQLQGPVANTISDLRHLAFLDLLDNKIQFNKYDVESLGMLCRLQTLKLKGNNIKFEFSKVLQSLSSCAHKSLVSLNLLNTQVWGPIPDNISVFSSLVTLNVANNQLNGTIGEGIGQLSRLTGLDLSYNNLSGNISHKHFSNLSSLSFMDLSYNPFLVLDLSPTWTPPFQLDELKLRFTKLGPDFPKWLTTQQNITILDISNTGISDIVPKSFWSASPSTIQSLNMSNNMIYGILPNLSITLQSLTDLDMSSNNLSGAIPSFLGKSLSTLLLHKNQFSHGLFTFVCLKAKTNLMTLDLSDNLISETIPDCWSSFTNLYVLKLQDNNITGNLPSSIAALPNLQALHVRNNKLHGELPVSWISSTSLVVLDLAYNSLTGSIPPSLGQGPRYLTVLSLSNNHFKMDIPSSLCQLSSLQILDLSNNHIFGTLPKCLYNLTMMANTKKFPQRIELYDGFPFVDIAWFMWKRKEQSFNDLLGLLKGIDVSNNNLHGEVPDEISSLAGVVFLNLSKNNLTGTIPSRIGQLTSLEFLDLSHNHLSGEIPTSLASISSLEILDLSKNNLSGKIPLGTQLQGFDASAYMGNPGLCGPPLSKCPGDQATPIPQNGDSITRQKDHKSDSFFLGLCISVTLGFIAGFWGVCGTLVLKRSWRHAFFRFYDDIQDRIHVMVVVYIARAFRRSSS